MGTLVLKSTCAAGFHFNTAPFVINELKVVGSRCGPFADALAILRGDRDDDDDDDDDDDHHHHHHHDDDTAERQQGEELDGDGPLGDNELYGSRSVSTAGGGGGEDRDDEEMRTGRGSGTMTAGAVRPGIPVPVDKYVSAVFDLKSIDKALELARAHRSLKVLLRMPEPTPASSSVP
jgi:hypothetical protein